MCGLAGQGGSSRQQEAKVAPCTFSTIKDQQISAAIASTSSLTCAHLVSAPFPRHSSASYSIVELHSSLLALPSHQDIHVKQLLPRTARVVFYAELLRLAFVYRAGEQEVATKARRCVRRGSDRWVGGDSCKDGEQQSFVPALSSGKA